MSFLSPCHQVARQIAGKDNDADATPHHFNIYTVTDYDKTRQNEHSLQDGPAVRFSFRCGSDSDSGWLPLPLPFPLLLPPPLPTSPADGEFMAEILRHSETKIEIPPATWSKIAAACSLNVDSAPCSAFNSYHQSHPVTPFSPDRSVVNTNPAVKDAGQALRACGSASDGTAGSSIPSSPPVCAACMETSTADEFFTVLKEHNARTAPRCGCTEGRAYRNNPEAWCDGRGDASTGMSPICRRPTASRNVGETAHETVANRFQKHGRYDLMGRFTAGAIPSHRSLVGEDSSVSLRTPGSNTTRCRTRSLSLHSRSPEPPPITITLLSPSTKKAAPLCILALDPSPVLSIPFLTKIAGTRPCGTWRSSQAILVPALQFKALLGEVFKGGAQEGEKAKENEDEKKAENA
ncbi:hypothetical protein DL770_010253 [Monosporascus sp. CRB-9-2]|nr:hypothetical protein DL770_010253 [Monosporascus sp. CRB-9-2]